MPEKQSNGTRRREGLRRGFSTGTAAVAAAIAALRGLLTGRFPAVVAVRLPSGIYLPVEIADAGIEGDISRATVVKDGGDDPDITNRARISSAVRLAAGADGSRGLFLIAGEGVGTVTKPGLPVPPGEPAINPGPRRMFVENMARELVTHGFPQPCGTSREGAGPENRSGVFVPFDLDQPFSGGPGGIVVEITVDAAGGEDLARHTLNPRLGVLGGISILGTTGIVKPFSHEAYEETIHAALSVAASSGCNMVVLSTGGKSEKFARDLFADEPAEAFVQIADFFAYSVFEARRFGFNRIVHSVFFGKALKMAQGHEYTHAHKVALDLEPLARMGSELGCSPEFCRELASANTARHAFEIIRAAGAGAIVEATAQRALSRSAHLAGPGASVELLLFDYDGRLLSKVSTLS